MSGQQDLVSATTFVTTILTVSVILILWACVVQGEVGYTHPHYLHDSPPPPLPSFYLSVLRSDP